MNNLIKMLSPLLILLGASASFAGTIKEYTADMVDTKTGQVAAKYYITEKKIRVDALDERSGRRGTGGVASIIRMDQNKMYAFQDDKTYIELPLKGTISNLQDVSNQMMGGAAPKRTEEKIGTETVSGYSTDKLKVTTTMNFMGRTHSTTNFEWKAKEFDIPLRIQTENGDTTEMRNIKVGAPSASVFEIPAGYTRNVEMENMMKGMHGRGMPDAGTANIGYNRNDRAASNNGNYRNDKASGDSNSRNKAAEAGENVAGAAGDTAVGAVKDNVNQAVKDGVNNAFKNLWK